MREKTRAAPPRGGALTRKFVVKNEYGIHARPAALFVKKAGEFESEIKVEKGGVEVSGKSIMGLLTLESPKGSTLKITAVGPDAERALDALQELFDHRFYED